MRLTPKEATNLLKVFAQKLSSISYQVFLFGSRADDLKRGGDVDLLLLVSEKDFTPVKEKKFDLKFDLEGVMDEQRVDLTICSKRQLEEDPFLKSIRNEMIELSMPLQS